MHQLWTKSLPTTSVKFVSITPKLSTGACLVSLLVILLTSWGILSSDFPLSVSFSFLGVFTKSILCQSFLVDRIRIPFRYTASGVIAFNDGQSKVVERLSMLYVSWFLIVIYQSGERQLLWRDSCHEADYRHLVLFEKRRCYHLRTSHHM
ncbi:hypothetical protein VQ7734_02902 [Vibrio quintilis]|uniref:Uncharacterized protein n=1 Tax=Vibrio quintilis TaxID=1117707 RepID=A0A1M7YX92_9VIBR|nr:hypothetical protein VQ7734_02902 [Vibrio quintilis]